MTSQDELFADRYARQAKFVGVGEQGQRRIEAGNVLVVGSGGLGSALVNLLARAGVGRITVVDFDVVAASNLPRQLLFGEAEVIAGAPKAVAAAEAVRLINSTIEVTPVVAKVTADNILGLVAGKDLVLDATDNLPARYLINDACVKLGVPWVYGGVVASNGMSTTIIPGETACFRCLFPYDGTIDPPPTCATVGVLASIVVIVAALQWTSAIKLLVGDREHINRGVTYIDVWTNDQLTSEPVQPDPDCPCCGQHRYDFLKVPTTLL